MRFLLIFIAFLLSTQIVFGLGCPSVKAIQAGKTKGWQLLDSEDGAQLSAARIKAFKKNIQQFVLAEWEKKDSRHGTIHCYYSNKSGSELDAYLARENFMPDNAKHLWYPVTGYLECAAGMSRCQFQSVPKTARFAKK